MSAVSSKTTMTWDQAEEHINKNPLALPNVRNIIWQAEGRHVSDYQRIKKEADACEAILFLGLLLIMATLGDMGLGVPLQHAGIAFGVIGGLTVAAEIILCVASSRRVRNISARIRRKIEVDKKNPERPFLAQLLKKDLEGEMAFMAEVNKSYQARAQESAARIAIIEPALKA